MRPLLLYNPMIQENNGLLKAIMPEQLKNKMNGPIL